MKDYNLGLMQPGEEREVNAFGDYIRNIGTGSIKVVARNTEKTVKALATVIGAGGWRSPESEYNHWVIKNNSIVEINVGVLIGKGEAGESEVQINADVNALTRFDNLTKDKNRYIGGYFAPAISAKYSSIALWNASQNNDLWLHSLKVSALSNMCFIRTINNLTDLYEVSSTYKMSKFIGETNGDGTIQSSILLGSDSLLGDVVTYVPVDVSGAVTFFDFKNSPFKIPVNAGLLVCPDVGNMSITGSFEWSEGNG